jgi:hypothetical protein
MDELMPPPEYLWRAAVVITAAQCLIVYVGLREHDKWLRGGASHHPLLQFIEMRRVSHDSMGPNQQTN